MGNREYGLDPDMVAMVAQEVKAVVAMGVQVCLVIGGGNIFRGVSSAAAGMDRASGDYMGMLATVINSRLAGAERAGAAGPADPGPVGDPDDDGVRTLYPPSCCSPYGKGRVVCRRHRQTHSSRPTPPPLSGPLKWVSTR